VDLAKKLVKLGFVHIRKEGLAWTQRLEREVIPQSMPVMHLEQTSERDQNQHYRIKVAIKTTVVTVVFITII
jgi:hypothetical protein